MAGTPEEDLLAWLDREEERVGFGVLDDAMADIELARALLYDELGYDITESQFGGLRDALEIRYEQMPTIGIGFERLEMPWGYETIYRDVITGRFVSPEDVWDLLKLAFP